MRVGLSGRVRWWHWQLGSSGEGHSVMLEHALLVCNTIDDGLERAGELDQVRIQVTEL